MDEWKRIHKEEENLSIEERASNQLVKLKDIISSFHTLFGSALIPAIKTVRKENLSENENSALNSIEDKVDLIGRIAGLVREFDENFYHALEDVLGERVFVIADKKKTEESDDTEQEQQIENEEERVRTAKLPKGFNKWDLKMIKLHESHPADGKRIWVDYWTLKGISNVGEILYNPTKDLFYFKPHQISTPSFAVTEEHARKVTIQARNYYFRISPNPPEEE